MIRETIKLWNEAVVSYDQGDFDKALSCLESITEPTAKIYFDIGCIYLSKGSPNKALESYAKTIQKDEHLAVGYFQHGVAAFKVNRITDALDSFQKAYFYMRGHSVIDYRQLGLTVLLYATQVLLNLALCLCRKNERLEGFKWLKDAESLESTQALKTTVSKAVLSIKNEEEFSLQELPLTAIFRPAKAVVSNLEKRDFLGKAKVVAALDQNDTFTGFVGPRKNISDGKHRQLRRLNSRSLDDVSQLLIENQLSPSVSPKISPKSPTSPRSYPPPPSAPPPRLPNRKFVLVQHSRSSENLASDGCSPIRDVKSPRNMKTDVFNKPTKPVANVLSPIQEKNKQFPTEAPEKPPKTYKQAGTDLKPKHQGKDLTRASKEPVTEKIAFSDATNTVSTVENSRGGEGLKNAHLRISRQPPSRPPPQPPRAALQCGKPSVPTKVNQSTVALHSYDPGDDSQLCFSQGEIITVEKEVEENWFQGRLRGKTGLVPWTYVQPITQRKNIFH